MKVLLLFFALSGLVWAEIPIGSGAAQAAEPPTATPTIAALKSLAGGRRTNGTYAFVAGYYAANDAGGGIFYFDSSSTAPDDGGSVIAPDSGNGRWLRIFDGPANVRQFGARGDGRTDDTKPIQTAINYAATTSPRVLGGELFFPSGFTGKITATLSIPAGLSGFSLVGEAPQDDPRSAQIQYDGPAARPIVIFSYSFVGHSGFQLIADAIVAGENGASARIIPPSPGYLAPGASESGSLGTIHGTLLNREGIYTFIRDSGGLTTTLVGNLDCYVPDIPAKGATVKADRAGFIRNLSFSGNRNAVGILFQGHGSGEMLENVRVQNVAIAVQITQPPAQGNDEFITFHRCNFVGYQYGLWVANGDSYAITVESCSIGVDSSVTLVGQPRAAIKVLSPNSWSPGQNGAGLNVYGGNIGTSNAHLPNNVAALEVSGVGDPISFSGVRSECVGTAVRLLNGAGSGRSIHFQSCGFTMNPRSLLAFSRSTHFDQGIFVTHQGRTYRVVVAGTSGGSGPTSTTKAPEANGSMVVVYIAATAAQDDYASYSYIVESGNYSSQDHAYAQSPGEHDSVTFDSTSFGTNIASGALAVDGAQYLSLRYNQCTFSGRLFEYTSPNQPMIVKSQCSFNPWRGAPQFICDDSEAGAPVNLIRENTDPTKLTWSIGPLAIMTRSPTATQDPYLPIMGGNGFRIGVAGNGKIYDTPDTMIRQDLEIAANLETGNDYYALCGSVPFFNQNRNGAVVVAVTDQKGFIMAKGIYYGGTRFSLPFAAGGAGLVGHILLWVGAMDVNNRSLAASVVMLQVGRNRDHTYIQTKDYAIDGFDLLHRDELFHGVVSAGRMILPSSQLGGVQSGPYDLRDGDVRVDANRRLSVFDGVAWEFHPRTFYQAGVAAPATGIWRVGDQILDATPTSGSFIGLVCTAAGAFTQTGGFSPADYGPWAANTFVKLSSYRYTAARDIYKCVREGITSGSAPAAAAGFVRDGTVWWEFMGKIAHPTFKTFGPISRTTGQHSPDDRIVDSAPAFPSGAGRGRNPI